MVLDPDDPPAPIRDFINAAVRTDFDTMFHQVDWQASRAAEWAQNIDSPYLPEDRADEMIAAGFHEFEDVSPRMVQSKLAEIALHVGLGGRLRGATDDGRARVLETLRVPEVKRTLPRNIAARLDDWRRRAAALLEAAGIPYMVSGSFASTFLEVEWARVRSGDAT